VTANNPSFEELYRRHAPSVYRRAQELLGSDTDAREVVQDLFVSLLERPAQFAGRSSLTTYLYSAATHTCLNRLRDRRNRARLLALHAQASATAQAPRAEKLVLLRDLLIRLPEELAQVAVYYHLDEMTYDEIAETMGCSRRHVATLLQRLSRRHDAPEVKACSNP
jgi:RNA polymerase sigma factor (sigma-70 family)